MIKGLLAVVAMSVTLFAADVSADKMAVCCSDPNYSADTNVIKAVSKSGINKEQTRKIAQGIVEYQSIVLKIKQNKVDPLDSFSDEGFDEQKFIAQMKEKYVELLAAKAALYKYVFSVLSKEQREVFKKEYAKINK